MKILAHYGDSEYTPERKRLNAYGAIGYYRVVKPTQQVKGHEVRLIGRELKEFGTILAEQWNNIFKEYDVFWCNYFSDEKVGAAMMWAKEKNGKKVIIDVDDNYLDIPETNKLYERFKRTKRDRAMLGAILSLADVITVSTYPLKERLTAHFKHIYGMEKEIVVIPNMNDLNDFKAEIGEKDTSKITIGYWGSNSHQDDLQMFLPALKNLMTKYPNLHFRAIGSIEKDLIPTYFKGFTNEMLNRVWVGAAESVFKKAPAWLASQGWDIGIAPLVDTGFTRCKSHIKWLEYSSFKIPTVASRVYPYFMPIKGKKTIEDGVTGLLASPLDWEKQLEKLIVDEKLRKQIGENAYEFVKKEWQYDNSDISQVVGKMLEKLEK